MTLFYLCYTEFDHITANHLMISGRKHKTRSKHVGCYWLKVPFQLLANFSNDAVFKADPKADFKAESITNKRVSSLALETDASLSTPD